MATKTVDIREAQENLSELLSLALAGTEVILTRDKTPVAKLVPIGIGGMPRIAGLHRGMIWTSDDFDAPLPDEFWTGG